MSLKGSLSRRYAGFTENTYLKNIATTNRTYSYWFYSQSNPQSAWSWSILGWYENEYPFTPAGSAKNTSLQMQKYPGTNFTLRGFNSAGGLTAEWQSGLLSFRWHHVAIVVDGSSTTVYVNGVSLGSSGILGTTHLFAFGKPIKHVTSKTDTSRYTAMPNCLIADLCVFNGALRQSDINILYANGSPSYARTSTSPVATSLLLRCPLEDDGIDVVSGSHIFGSHLAMEFSTLSPFSNPSTTNILSSVINPGVCSSHILGGRNNAYIIDLGDSFGSFSANKVDSALFNKLNFNKNISNIFVASGFTDFTGNTGTLQVVNSSNSYRVECSTTRTITASSWSNNVLTLTYSGPNLVVGSTIKLVSNGSYLTVASFTAGSGIGTSQTGAIITASLNSNPGSLVGDTITVHCALPSTIHEWYDNNGTSTSVGQWTLYPYTPTYSGSQYPFGGPLLKYVDWLILQGAVLRVYHRVASDVAIQAKSVKITAKQNDGTTTNYGTISGLDNASYAGKIQVLADIPLSQVKESAGGESGATSVGCNIDTTGTAADTQNRYLCIVGYEIIVPNSTGIGFATFSEQSWSYGGVGYTSPGLKQMDQLTIDSFVKSFVDQHSNKQPIISITMDVEDMTPTQWYNTLTGIKNAWDTAFTRAKTNKPKYLIYGTYFHEVSGGTLAYNRGVIVNQNLGAMRFAKANPQTVEFISLYKISEGIFAPSFELSVGPTAPSNIHDGTAYAFDDSRVTPMPFNISDATWDKGTLTITKTNGFNYYLFNASNSLYKTYVYVEPTSNTGTPVVAGWYQLASMTGSTLVTTSSITGGSAGVGADVRVVALWQTSFTGLHLQGFGSTVVSDWIIFGLLESVNAYYTSINDINKINTSLDYQTTGKATVSQQNKPISYNIEDGSNINIKSPRINNDIQPSR